MKVQEIAQLDRNEADVVGEFVHRIRTDGLLNVHLEVKLPSKWHRSGRFRVDALLVTKDEDIVCAVEFKRPGKKVGARTRQRLAYADLPFPHFFVIGRHGMKKVIPEIYGLIRLI